jgi:predicted AAA+ superfamily ATPase
MIGIIRDVTIKARKHRDTDEILIFVGARQAGKTTVLKQIQDELQNRGEHCYFLNLEDPEYLDLLNKTPRNIFKIFSLDQNVKNFIFVDEVQYLKNPSNFLKFIYDEYKEKIKLIVSGSSAFYLDKKFKDSLAGRKQIFNIFTLSFREFLKFKGEEKLRDKDFQNLSLEEKNKISIYYREFMIFGGYPRVVLSAMEEKKEILRELAYSHIKKDILEAGVRQEEIFYKLFKILAKQIGNLVNVFELANTLNVSKTSINNYLYTMQKSFHLVLIRPFSGNTRKEISKMPKVFFLDFGLRNFFADNFNPFDLRDDKGQLLENAFFRELMEIYDRNEIKFWRTSDQKEIDFIVDGNAYEVKTNIKSVKKKDCDAFLEKYPDMKLSIVSVDVKSESANGYSVSDVWQAR